MKIVIPMAGHGARFAEKGYGDIKPMIKLGRGRTMIDHVVGMFSDPSDQFVFLCNQDHLFRPGLREELLRLAPNSVIAGVESHRLGPIWTVLGALDYIGDDEEVIVSYCDGVLIFDREDFIESIRGERADGCLFTHTGFQPHTLSATKMAFIREENGCVLEVQEKASYTPDPMSEHASSGVYYFRTGALLKHYFKRTVDENLSHNGEYYVTLAYNPMIRDGLRVVYYDTPYVAILGTPTEVENYEIWDKLVHTLSEDNVVALHRYWKRYWELYENTNRPAV